MRDTMRSQVSRKICGIQKISQWTKNRIIEENQHIEETAENRSIKKARDQSVNGRGTKGCP